MSDAPTSDDSVNLIVAERQAETARQRLAGTLVELQARLNPKALARDAVQELKESGQEIARDGLDAVKRHPLTVGGIAAAIGLFLARRPIRRLLGGQPDETAEPLTSLTSNRARARAKGKSE
jgi:ElaB/YqjD/DUF883 family membrane-anchored ribosome-binding protein